MPKCGQCLHAKLVPSCNPELSSARGYTYNQASSSRASTYNQDLSTGRASSSAYDQDKARANTYNQDSSRASTYNQDSSRASTYNQDSSRASASGSTYNHDLSTSLRASSSAYNQDRARANTYNQDSASGNAYKPYVPTERPYNQDSSTGYNHGSANNYDQRIQPNRANAYDARQPTASIYTYTVPFVHDSTTPSTTPYYNPYGRLPAAQSHAASDERCRDIPEGDTRAIGRCRQDYIECRIGQAIVRYCSDPLVFDSATRVCSAPASLPQCSSAKSSASSSGTLPPSLVLFQ
jgi:hypothetical protein